MGNAESFKQHALYCLQSQKEKPVEKERLRMDGEGKGAMKCTGRQGWKEA